MIVFESSVQLSVFRFTSAVVVVVVPFICQRKRIIH